MTMEGVANKWDLTVDQAMAMLDVYRPEPDPDWNEEEDGPEDLTPTVHCFMDGGGIAIGADWSLDDVRRLIERHGAQVAGPQASRMGHGVVVMERRKPRFFATRSDSQLVQP